MPRRIDAEPPHGVARPAASIAARRERLLGAEDAAAAQRLGVDQEVALLAKQPEAVLGLPLDAGAAAPRLREGGQTAEGRDKDGDKSEDDT